LQIRKYIKFRGSLKIPSPAGEGWGEENKINCLYPPHPDKGEGADTCVDTYAQRESVARVPGIFRDTHNNFWGLIFVMGSNTNPNKFTHYPFSSWMPTWT
jgi:hypothetical protein